MMVRKGRGDNLKDIYEITLTKEMVRTLDLAKRSAVSAL